MGKNLFWDLFRRIELSISWIFVGHLDASLDEQFFDFTETQAESMVEAHGVTDNFRGEPVSLVAGGWLFHAAQSAKPELN